MYSCGIDIGSVSTEALILKKRMVEPIIMDSKYVLI